MTPDIIASALGLIIGIILALTGAGGTILAIPLLVFFLNLTIPQAAPVALFALALSASYTALIGLKAGIVRYKAASLMAILGMSIAPIGVWLAHYLPAGLVSLLFALVLIYVALHMWQNPPSNLENTSPAVCQTNPITSRLFWTAECTARLSLAGSVAGLLSGLLGVGGGFVIVPSLRKVSSFDMQTIIATSLAVIALISTSGFLTYALRSTINWEIVLPFGISTLVGTFIGRTFAVKIPANLSQRMFSMLAITASAVILMKQFV